MKVVLAKRHFFCFRLTLVFFSPAVGDVRAVLVGALTISHANQNAPSITILMRAQTAHRRARALMKIVKLGGRAPNWQGDRSTCLDN